MVFRSQLFSISKKYTKGRRNLTNLTLRLTSLLILCLPILLFGCSGGDVSAISSPTSSGGTTGGTGGDTGGTITPPSNNLSLSAITFGVNPLSAFGTTSVSVTVYNNGVLYTTPVTVNFDSICAQAGKADLTASTLTSNGVAKVSYVDNACAATDTVIANITDGPSKSGTLTVAAPEIGSITSVSANPSLIGIRGTGGIETSRVTFKVFDIGGTGIGGQQVNFSLNTTIGGITLSSPSSITDSSGLVYVDVHAGTVGTPVRVTASTLTLGGETLSTQSSQLVISTGLPDQNSISFSNETAFNIEGMNWDGVTAELVIRMADHFNNPVPDGTAVYFTTEGGSIDPSCTTVNGNCSVTLTSQEPRPVDGRVTVLAYAIGEESFNDLDGDGLADLSPNETIQDLPEAWLDTNYDHVKDVNEQFMDFNNNGLYDSADGLFNTSLCNETPDPLFPTRVSSAGSCSSQKTTYVRTDMEVVFSTSKAGYIMPYQVTAACTKTPNFFTLTILDQLGNPMPAGTTINLKSVGGSLNIDPASYTVASGSVAGSGITDFLFATIGGQDCISGVDDSIRVDVTSPKGTDTFTYISADIP